MIDILKFRTSEEVESIQSNLKGNVKILSITPSDMKMYPSNYNDLGEDLFDITFQYDAERLENILRKL